MFSHCPLSVGLVYYRFIYLGVISLIIFFIRVVLVLVINLLVILIFFVLLLTLLVLVIIFVLNIEWHYVLLFVCHLNYKFK